jgi:hypothetical protein
MVDPQEPRPISVVQTLRTENLGAGTDGLDDPIR